MSTPRTLTAALLATLGGLPAQRPVEEVLSDLAGPKADAALDELREHRAEALPVIARWLKDQAAAIRVRGRHGRARGFIGDPLYEGTSLRRTQYGRTRPARIWIPLEPVAPTSVDERHRDIVRALAFLQESGGADIPVDIDRSAMALLAHSQRGVAFEAANLLACLPSDRQTQLAPLLKDRQRTWLAHALAGRTESGRAAVRKLAGSAVGTSATRVALALATTPKLVNAADAAILVQCLGSKSAECRRLAAWGLGRAPAAVAVPAIAEALESSDNAVVSSAMTAMAAQGTAAHELVPRIQSIATGYGWAADMATELLGLCQREPTPESVRVLLESSAEVGGKSLVATRALGELVDRSAEAQARILELANTGTGDQKLLAIRALGRSWRTPEEVTTQVVAALNNGDTEAATATIGRVLDRLNTVALLNLLPEPYQTFDTPEGYGGIEDAIRAKVRSEHASTLTHLPRLTQGFRRSIAVAALSQIPAAELDRSRASREGLAQLLAKTATSDHATLVESLTSDPEPAVRLPGFCASARLGQVQLDSERLQQLLTSEDAAELTWGLRTLGALGEPAAEKGLPLAFRHLSNLDPAIQMAAVDAIAGMRPNWTTAENELRDCVQRPNARGSFGAFPYMGRLSELPPAQAREQLQSKQPIERISGLLALARSEEIDRSNHLDAVASMLTDPIALVRRNAAAELHRFGWTADADESLRRMLDSADAADRATAAEALGRAPVPDAKLSKLLADATADESHLVRRAALTALGDARWPVADETLIAAMQDSDSKSRVLALDAAAARRIQHEEVLEFARATLAKERRAGTDEIAACLRLAASMGSRAADLEPLFAHHHRSINIKVYTAATQALDSCAELTPHLGKVIQHLDDEPFLIKNELRDHMLGPRQVRRDLKSSDTASQRRGLQFLIDNGPRAARLLPLALPLLRAQANDVRHLVVDTVAATRPDLSGVPARLRMILDDPDEFTSYSIGGGPPIVDPTQHLQEFDHADPKRREYAVWAVTHREVDNPSRYFEDVKSLLNDPVPAVQHRAFRTVAYCGWDRETELTLRQHLAAGDAATRLAAVEGFSDAPWVSADCVDALRTTARNDSSEIRTTALRMLRQKWGKTARPEFLAGLDDANENIREMAWWGVVDHHLLTPDVLQRAQWIVHSREDDSNRSIARCGLRVLELVGRRAEGGKTDVDSWTFDDSLRGDALRTLAAICDISPRLETFVEGLQKTHPRQKPREMWIGSTAHQAKDALTRYIHGK